MKIATRILSLFVMVGLATFYMSCDNGGGDDKTPEEIQLSKLAGTWTVSSATDMNGPRTDFAGVQLALSGTYTSPDDVYNYQLTGTLPDISPWPRSGNWQFGTDPATSIIRDPSGDDEIDMAYSVSDDGTLTLIFNVPEGKSWNPGRTRNVAGEWIFVFTKQ